jgi:hypothetical protein
MTRGNGGGSSRPDDDALEAERSHVRGRLSWGAICFPIVLTDGLVAQSVGMAPMAAASSVAIVFLLPIRLVMPNSEGIAWI